MFHKIYIFSIAIALVNGVTVDSFAGGKKVRVPPADELLIISPKVDSLDKPRPIFVDNGNQTQHLEIPPTVIVHQYYYSGDRKFQGPMLPGGPTILVANHPKTGEQIQLRAQLKPGAPIVHYSRNAIRYEYPDQWIVLNYGCQPLTQPHVVIRQKSKVIHATRGLAKGVTGTTGMVVSKTGLGGAAVAVDQGAKNAFVATAEKVGETGRFVCQPVVNLIQSTPLSSFLTPSSGDVDLFGNPLRSSEIVDEFENTVPTNR